MKDARPNDPIIPAALRYFRLALPDLRKAQPPNQDPSAAREWWIDAIRRSRPLIERLDDSDDSVRHS